MPCRTSRVPVASIRRAFPDALDLLVICAEAGLSLDASLTRVGREIAVTSPALAEELRLDSATEGVAVLEVADGSIAQNLGFQRGDVVLAINNEAVRTTADLQRATGQASRLWRVTILRSGQQISVMFGG